MPRPPSAHLHPLLRQAGPRPEPDYLRGDPSRKYPISHYVGWTSQRPPINRVRQHGAKSAHYVAQIRPGTVRDEERAKCLETCPRCGQSLWYYAESPTYSEEYADNALPVKVLFCGRLREGKPDRGPDQVASSADRTRTPGRAAEIRCCRASDLAWPPSWPSPSGPLRLEAASRGPPRPYWLTNRVEANL